MEYNILYTKAITSVTRVVVRSVAGFLCQVTDHLDDDENDVIIVGLATKGKEGEVVFCYSSSRVSHDNSLEVESIIAAVAATAEGCSSKREFKELLEIELDFAQQNLGESEELNIRRDDHNIARHVVDSKAREYHGFQAVEEPGNLYTANGGSASDL